jgi:hypothetical protein
MIMKRLLKKYTMPNFETTNPTESPDTLPIRDFNEIRTDVAERFFNDPSYTVFDAMYEMSEAAGDYVGEVAQHYPANALWVGGSLGRREMLPNSDIDLFVIYDEEGYAQNDIHVDGVDKFEIGHIEKNKLRDLLKYSFIDANRFIDGRRVGSVEATDVEQMIGEVNTADRQLANNISEYFYYRYFDFTQKTTPIGPNLKYSTGSSRDTIFFNMISRMTTQQFPARRGTEPELAEVLRHAEDHYGLKPPVEAINLIFTAKNVAISSYDATHDPRNKYVSQAGLESIYNFCRDKFKALGYADEQRFVDGYRAARQEIELTVDTLFNLALGEHPASTEMEQILSLPSKDLPEACIAQVNDEGSQYPQSLITLTAWMMMRNRSSAEDMDKVAQNMIRQPIDKVWGGLMAVVCSPETADSTLSNLSDWLLKNEKGAYLLKLITRNPATSPETRIKALSYYRKKEIIL